MFVKHKRVLFGLLALAVLVAQAPATDGAKILAVYAFAGKSHYMMHRVLISELLKHGHEVCTNQYDHHDNGTHAGDSLPNIMVMKWLPQNDILAHPNVRVFISHGGLFGSQEALYHAVPVLGMPFYCDQHLNLKKAESNGYAIVLNFHTLTSEQLKYSLHQLLHNSTYRDNIKRFSSIFHDRPMGPRETAIYWIDYVIRHKGARHLRSAGLDLKWYQFYLLDVIALVAAAVAVSIGVLVLLIRWILRQISGKKIKQKVN